MLIDDDGSEDECEDEGMLQHQKQRGGGSARPPLAALPPGGAPLFLPPRDGATARAVAKVSAMGGLPRPDPNGLTRAAVFGPSAEGAGVSRPAAEPRGAVAPGAGPPAKRGFAAAFGPGLEAAASAAGLRVSAVAAATGGSLHVELATEQVSSSTL